MRDIKTLINELIRRIKQKPGRIGLCVYTRFLLEEPDQSLIDRFLRCEIMFNTYDGFDSCLSRSVNNHTGVRDIYFFKRYDTQIRLKWLHAVIEKIDNGELCPESLDVIKRYADKYGEQ